VYCSAGRDALISRRVGDVQVTVTAEPDEDWYSMQDCRFIRLREFDSAPTMYRTWALVARNEELVRMPGKDIWRDARGRIAAAPEPREYSRDYEYIAVPAADIGAETIAQVLADAKQLDDLNEGRATMYGIVARVTVDGAEIGSSSVWGVWSDFSRDAERHVMRVAREQVHEATHEARAWLARRNKEN